MICKMAGFALRVKTKSGHVVVKDLTPQSTITDLKTKLSNLTKIPQSFLSVLVGYPPKAVDLKCGASTLEKSGIHSGDTLIVEQKKEDVQEASTEEGRTHAEIYMNSPGILMRKVVPADNSCLFTSVGFVLRGVVDTTCGSYMREMIANALSSDPDTYTEGVLGKTNEQYCKWIVKPDSWGGAIEISVLSKVYGMEIVVVDTVNCIINRFGEDRLYGQRVLLIFDGIHYDPLFLEPLQPGGQIQTIFNTEDDGILLQAQELAQEAKSSHQFTDVDHFKLKCMECHVMLKGQVEAQQHAQETGHLTFGEVAS